jgi:hypothetical protein
MQQLLRSVAGCRMSDRIGSENIAGRQTTHSNKYVSTEEYLTKLVQLLERMPGKPIPKVAVPWLRRLVAGLSSRRPGFDPGSVHVGFMVDSVALGHVFPRVLRFSPVSFIPPVLHYLEKRKNESSSSQGCTIRLKAAVRP